MFSVLRKLPNEKTAKFDYILNDILSTEIALSDVVHLCSKLSVIETLTLLEEINQELQFASLECLILEDYLNNNDPKLLVGLTKQVEQDLKLKDEADAEWKKTNVKLSIESTNKLRKNTLANQKSFINRAKSNASLGTTGTRDYKAKEYSLNYKTRCELSTKLAKSLAQQIKELERKGCRNLRDLHVTIEEKKFEISEAHEALKSFDKNVVNLGYDPTTRLISSEKFLKFCKIYLHNGMGICAKIRITANNTSHEIHALTIKLVAAEEIHAVITTTDFKLLDIRKENQINDYEEKSESADHSRMLAGKLAIEVSAQKKLLMAADKDYKGLLHKVEEAKRRLTRKEDELLLIRNEVENATTNLERLKKLNSTSEAPSIQQYIDLSRVLTNLAREKKMLNQKIHIYKIHLANAKHKYNSKKKM